MTAIGAESTPAYVGTGWRGTGFERSASDKVTDAELRKTFKTSQLLEHRIMLLRQLADLPFLHQFHLVIHYAGQALADGDDKCGGVEG